MKNLAETEELPAADKGAADGAHAVNPLIRNFLRLFFGNLSRLWPSLAANLAFDLFQRPRTRAQHRSTDGLLSAMTIKDLEHKGMRLKHYEWGDATAPTILLVHGWESRGTALRHFVPRLLAEGYHVATFDGPAHGDSPGKRTNLPDYAQAVLGALRLNGEVAGIIAHSFGGTACAYCFSQLVPERRLPKLVAIGMPCRMRDVFQHFADLIRLSPQAHKKVERRVEQLSNMQIDDMSNDKMLANEHVERLLIVHDRNDKVVPFSDAKEVFEANHDKAKMLITNGLGHFRLAKDSKVVDRVVRFLVEK